MITDTEQVDTSLTICSFLLELITFGYWETQDTSRLHHDSQSLFIANLAILAFPQGAC